MARGEGKSMDSRTGCCAHSEAVLLEVTTLALLVVAILLLLVEAILLAVGAR